MPWLVAVCCALMLAPTTLAGSYSKPFFRGGCCGGAHLLFGMILIVNKNYE